MTVETPKNSPTVFTYELIAVPSAPGLAAGTIKKLLPETPASPNANRKSTLGVPLLALLLYLEDLSSMCHTALLRVAQLHLQPFHTPRFETDSFFRFYTL